MFNINWDIIQLPDQRGLLYLYMSSYIVMFCSKLKSKNWNDNNFNLIVIFNFKTNITEELMMYVWNPTRVEKWKYLLDDDEEIV